MNSARSGPGPALPAYAPSLSSNPQPNPLVRGPLDNYLWRHGAGIAHTEGPSGSRICALKWGRLSIGFRRCAQTGPYPASYLKGPAPNRIEARLTCPTNLGLGVKRGPLASTRSRPRCHYTDSVLTYVLPIRKSSQVQEISGPAASLDAKTCRPNLQFALATTSANGQFLAALGRKG